MTEKRLWSERKLVFPWDESGSIYSPREIQYAYEYLNKTRYPLHRMKVRPNSAALLTATEKIMTLIMRRRWVLALSSHAALLQALAIICPVCFTLTTLEPSRNVSNADLIQLFDAKTPSDDWEDDPAGETYDKIVKTGLLVWTGVNEMTSGAKYQASRFLDLLTRRSLMKFPILFTAVYSMSETQNFNEKFMEEKMKEIENCIGTGAVGVLREKSEVLNFIGKVRIPEVKTVSLED
jgi:hypothetical protein